MELRYDIFNNLYSDEVKTLLKWYNEMNTVRPFKVGDIIHIKPNTKTDCKIGRINGITDMYNVQILDNPRISYNFYEYEIEHINNLEECLAELFV